MLSAGLLLLATGLSVQAQELPTRIREAGGEVAFHFALRRDVEVCDDGIVLRGQRMRWHWRGDGGASRCSTGLAEVVLSVRDGRVVSVELEPWEGEGSTPAGTVDLGRVGAAEGASFLVSLARAGRDEDEAARSAMAAAMVADSARVAPALLEVARDRKVSGDVRTTAVFWLGQAAGEAVTEGLGELARTEDEEQEIRDAAVFAL
ncbi:MAG TPA: hypothetical protein VE173_04145, partial [Longimicrobiales bacterium]|nr:hypothetical protein [Longimicrobiales bacterium]